MATINLLPWRDKFRHERKKRFVQIWVLTAMLSIGLIFLGDMFISKHISHQRERNQYIQNEITKLKMQSHEIRELKILKEGLLERMQVLYNLQGNRPVLVRIFDQIARVVPDGIYFKQVVFHNNRLNLIGVSESNNLISNLMRNFDNSEWFAEPNLTAVRKVSENSERWNEFDLTVKQINPRQIKEGL